MKLITILITILVVSGCKNSGNNYFTGTIEYAYSYTSDSLNADSLSKARYSKGIFRYDFHNYQSKFEGIDTATSYYSGTFNKSLSELNNDHKYVCEDYSVLNDSVLSFKLLDTNEKILGYSCKILEMQKKNSLVRYHVSNDLKTAPATYTGHKTYNWDFYGEKANGGLILKVEHRFKYFTLHGIATNIVLKQADFKALEIDEKIFSQFCN